MMVSINLETLGKATFQYVLRAFLNKIKAKIPHIFLYTENFFHQRSIPRKKSKKRKSLGKHIKLRDIIYNVKMLDDLNVQQQLEKSKEFSL